MARIRVAVDAWMLDLFPQTERQRRAAARADAQASRLRPLASGLAVPSFWSAHGITQAFDAANRIWIREADIEFAPVVISERTETVPAESRGMWIHFINNLSPGGRGVGVAFVYDLPDEEGGWGGGRIAAISGLKAAEGLPGFAGNLLAHELGHVLIDDPQHGLAGDDHSNLMHRSRNPRVANAGMLNPRQVQLARTRALAL